MIAGVLVGAVCVLAGVAAGYVVARTSAAQLVARPSQVAQDDEPAVFVQSEASEYLRELQNAELNGLHAAGWEGTGVYRDGEDI